MNGKSGSVEAGGQGYFGRARIIEEVDKENVGGGIETNSLPRF